MTLRERVWLLNLDLKVNVRFDNLVYLVYILYLNLVKGFLFVHGLLGKDISFWSFMVQLGIVFQ